MLTEMQLAELAEATGEELIQRAERMLALGRELLGMSAKVAENPSQVPITGEEVRQLLPADRSVGRFGAVTEGIALAKARDMGEFTTLEFAEALGVDGPATMKWIGRLLGMEPAVLLREHGRYRCLLKPPLKIWVARQAGTAFTFDEAMDATGLSDVELEQELGRLLDEGVVQEEEGVWEYVPPAGGSPREHPTRTPPERYPPAYADARATGMPVRIRTERKQRGGRSTPGQRQKIINNELQWERMQAAREKRAEDNKRRQAEQAAKPKKQRGRK